MLEVVKSTGRKQISGWQRQKGGENGEGLLMGMWLLGRWCKCSEIRVVVVVQPSEYIKTHRTVHCKCVDFMACKLYLRLLLTKQTRK